jgi:hypothetical protein
MEMKAVLGAFLDLTKEDPRREVLVDDWLSAANQRLSAQQTPEEQHHRLAN